MWVQTKQWFYSILTWGRSLLDSRLWTNLKCQRRHPFIVHSMNMGIGKQGSRRDSLRSWRVQVAPTIYTYTWLTLSLCVSLHLYFKSINLLPFPESLYFHILNLNIKSNFYFNDRSPFPFLDQNDISFAFLPSITIVIRDLQQKGICTWNWHEWVGREYLVARNNSL